MALALGKALLGMTVVLAGWVTIDQAWRRRLGDAEGDGAPTRCGGRNDCDRGCREDTATRS